MEKKIIEGLWDCKYCDQKGISGLQKHCPTCGRPQDEDTEFYIGTVKKYVSEDKADQYGKGADWTCGYCDSLNRHDAVACANCGAPREETTGDYFANEKRQKEEAARKAAEEKAKRDAERAAQIREEKARKKPIRLAILIGILAVLAFILMPRNKGAELTAKEWARSIAIQEQQTVRESDWTVPDGGTLVSTSEEIHHYDQVIDHYENVEVQRSREVLDGYDEETEIVNNGDGTFTEQPVQVPRYRTEYYTEVEQQPVYVNVPVLQTWYTYDIDKWIDTRTVDTSGKEDAPYWGEVSLASKEREADRTEQYTLTFSVKKKVYSVDVNEEIWDSLQIGDSADVTIQNGRITKINGTDIR